MPRLADAFVADTSGRAKGGRATIESHGPQLGKQAVSLPQIPVVNSLLFCLHTIACPCSGPESQVNATGHLEVTCNECGASLHVTAHLAVNVHYTTNNFSMKTSMHAQGCSLRKEKVTHANMATLPSLGRSVTVSKGRFTAVRL